MKKQIAPLVFIFFCTTVAWLILGTAVISRTNEQDLSMKRAVGQLWGTIQKQEAPAVYFETREKKEYTTYEDGKSITRVTDEVVRNPINLEASDIKVDLKLDYRKKGLLWYSTYRVNYQGRYQVLNDFSRARTIFFDYPFPTAEGIYDDFSLIVDGQKIKDTKPVAGRITVPVSFAPNQARTIEIGYGSQGMDEWWYVFGGGVSQIRNFNLTITTDFKKIDFLENSISPTARELEGKGWKLNWHYADLISGIQIGLGMPDKVNPGPFVSRVTFFAPVSLFLFLFLMFIITTLKQIRIHPMNYFFVCAAFFSFHLLLAYLADHVDINLALIISSIVSIFLVISYMRLVAGARFAFVETGISQFVYLVLFSYTFFLQGYTGLAITILCIITLFIIMQITGRIDWSKQYSKT
jgi:inner membrane protein involved in colicin E2 resistance